MSKKRNKEADIEKIAERAHRGEDVSRHFTGRHVAKQRIDIDLPLGFLRLIHSATWLSNQLTDRHRAFPLQ